MTSHVGDLDAGVSVDRAALGSGRSLVSTLPRQGAEAAMATQVSPVASFGAEAWWRLKQKHTFILQIHSNKALFIWCYGWQDVWWGKYSLFSVIKAPFSLHQHSCSLCLVFCIQPATVQTVLSAPISLMLETSCVKSVLCNTLLMACNVLALSSNSFALRVSDQGWLWSFFYFSLLFNCKEN